MSNTHKLILTRFATLVLILFSISSCEVIEKLVNRNSTEPEWYLRPPNNTNYKIIALGKGNSTVRNIASRQSQLHAKTKLSNLIEADFNSFKTDLSHECGSQNQMIQLIDSIFRYDIIHKFIDKSLVVVQNNIVVDDQYVSYVMLELNLE